MVLKILKWPNSALLRRTVAVSVFDESLDKFAKDLIETMRAEGGIGLAANQVGDSRRVAVIEAPKSLGEWSDKYGEAPIVLVNPIIYESQGEDLSKEGCLSLPEVVDTIRRFKVVKVKYQDIRGEHKEIETSGLMAYCLQHEIDHLDGKTLVEKASKVKKDMILRRLRKTGNL